MTWSGGRTASSARTSSAAWRAIASQAWDRDGGRCTRCGGPGHEVDHVVPVSLGGRDALANAAVLCAACHTAKTTAEATASRRARAARARHPVGRHPGLL